MDTRGASQEFMLDVQDDEERREARSRQVARRDLRQAAGMYAMLSLSAAILDGAARALEAEVQGCTQPHRLGHTGLKSCALCRRYREAFAIAVARPQEDTCDECGWDVVIGAHAPWCSVRVPDGDFDVAREDDCRR